MSTVLPRNSRTTHSPVAAKSAESLFRLAPRPAACALLFLIAAGPGSLRAGNPGGRVEYVGGTLQSLAGKPAGSLITTDGHLLVFATRSTALRVPYDKVNLLEYGQKVDRRYGMAIVISPLFLLSKSRRHFLTIGYSDDEGRQQAMVFRVDKNDIRALLVSLEARTGRKVQFQDEEARKAGKG